MDLYDLITLYAYTYKFKTKSSGGNNGNVFPYRHELLLHHDITLEI